ncbi:DUF6185 family protein [Streptomyces sp. NPDC048506]|uniref:DUF6185 family protein n=1 Tax=Streptomyces sp. NPDC048506 TaxID=3155028 RepID=UPI00343F14D8
MPAAEMSSPAWRWFALAFAVLGWWGVSPLEAHAADVTSCPTIQQPGKVKVDSRIFFSRQPKFVKVRQKTSVEVPKQNGEFVNDLTLSPKTPKYQHALHCLLLGSGKSPKSITGWHPEWQSTNHQATQRNGLVTLPYESWNLIGSAGKFEVGPWLIKVAVAKDWVATLHPSNDLAKASWRTIEVDSGGLEISDAPGASSARRDHRVWIGHKPDVRAEMVPPREIPALSRRVSLIVSVGIASWWFCASGVIAASAWPFLGLGNRKAAGNPQHHTSRNLASAVLEWAGLSAALGLTLLLLLRPSPSVNTWRAVIGISSGFTLVLLARPWLPMNQDSDGSPRGLKGRKVAVVTAAAAVAGVGLLVILDPQLFDLPSDLIPKSSPPASGIAALALLDLSMLWLLFTAMAAWGWRFAREGRLGEPSSGTRPEYSHSSSGSGLKHPLLRIAATGVALAAVAAVVVAFRILSFEFGWKRANWLGEASTLFHTDHGTALSGKLADFASVGPQWAYAYTWVLAGVALVALLHSNSRTAPQVSLGPEGADLLLVAAVFAIVVALRVASFAGSVAAVYGFWLPLNMVALYVMVKAGRRWSVLSRVDRKAGKNGVAAELSDPARHRQLLEDARRCRDLLHRLHVVDQGRGEGTTRRNLEKQLRSLHHWRPSGCRHDCLPDAVTVVDVALSWGPHPGWWQNAVNAARWAAIFGILPSMVTAWYDNAHGADHWTFTVDSPTGIPDTIGAFLTQEIAFAGAGLVLGALWRVLPGERGPARAFTLFIVWLVPIGVVATINRNIGSSDLGLAVLRVVLMLMVLTVTSMWMDTDTFSRERHYLTKRLSLLASVYQLYGLSGHIAFLMLQAGAAVAIWHQLASK